MAEKDKDPSNQLLSVLSVSKPQAVEDHELDLRAINSIAVSINQVGKDLTLEQKMFVLRRLAYDNLETLENLPPTATFLIEKIENISIEESVQIVKKAAIDYEEDVNYETKAYELLQKLVKYSGAQPGIVTDLSQAFANEKEVAGHETVVSTASEEGQYHQNTLDLVDWNLQVRIEAVLIAYYSPYTEVRAVIDPFDDPSIPVETVRVYVLGLIWTAIGAVINQFFYDRKPKVSLSSSVVQLFLYPSGRLLEYILPKWKFKVWKYEIDLNPGPWSHKEQMLATLFYSVSGGVSYTASNITIQKLELFYDNKWVDFGYQVLLTLASNFMGFGFAGIMRRFTVYPVQAMWPTVLPTIALNKAMMQPEKSENINGWKISRYYFFFLSAGISFIYFWLPNYLFQALSTFNWITWIAPNNFNLAAISGSGFGLGLNPIPSFDWNVLSHANPLAIPFYNYANLMAGSLIAMFCIIGIYWSNNSWTGYLPINSASLFSNTGEQYDVTAVVNSKSLFDEKKYQEVGPPYYSAANLITYASYFILYPFAIFYECIGNHKVVYSAFRGMFVSLRDRKKSMYDGFDDPHSIMMRKYKEVPDWVFLIILIISVVLAIICVKVYPAQTPVWGIFFALAINFVFLIPLTSIYSRTGFSFGLNVLVELIVGYALPGNGLALIFIKALGTNIDQQAQNYITNQKQAHYLKIPPRALFRTQMLSVIVSSFVQLGILNFVLTNIKGYCTPTQSQKFSCPESTVFYSASVIWGVIGPKKVFGGLYPKLQWCFLIGFLAVFPCLALKKYGSKKLTKYFEPSIVIGGLSTYAPYNLSYYTGGFYLSFSFMYYIRKYYVAWWEKYVYILGGGLTAGVAFGAIIIFFAVQYHDKSINWWGNTVPYEGIDGGIGRQSRLQAADATGGYFGIRKGHYP